jgi:hypothetical protein
LDHGLASDFDHVGDFYYIAVWAGAAYLWSAIILMIGGIIQAVKCSPRAAIWSLAFAVAASVVGAILWHNYNYTGFSIPAPGFPSLITDLVN